jgi:hypothetical protein
LYLPFSLSSSLSLLSIILLGVFKGRFRPCSYSIPVKLTKPYQGKHTSWNRKKRYFFDKLSYPQKNICTMYILACNNEESEIYKHFIFGIDKNYLSSHWHDEGLFSRQ